jgi:hypothetical protein
MAADQLTGFPFQNETLRYRVIWPGGGSLGDVTLTAHKAGDGGWDFGMSTSVAIPIVPVSLPSWPSTDLCSSTLQREISQGNKKVSIRRIIRHAGRPRSRPAAARASSPFPPAGAMR